MDALLEAMPAEERLRGLTLEDRLAGIGEGQLRACLERMSKKGH